MGFEWNIGISTFDKRLKELAAYKGQFGDCNARKLNQVPIIHMEIGAVRLEGHSSKANSQGKTSRDKLTQDQIERLE